MPSEKTKSEKDEAQELLANDGNFMAKFLAMQKEEKTQQKEFNITGKWVMIDSTSGDKYKYSWFQTFQGSFTGEQRGAGQVTHGKIDGDQISWQVADIGCKGRLLSDSKLVEGSYFKKDTGEKLGSFSGERQEESEKSRNEDKQRGSRKDEDERRRRREEDEERRRKEEAEKRRKEEDQRRLRKEEEERRRRREEDERRRRREEDEGGRRRQDRRRDDEDERSRRRRREEEDERRRRSRSRSRDDLKRKSREEDPLYESKKPEKDKGRTPLLQLEDSAEQDAKRQRLKESLNDILQESANPAPFSKAMGPPAVLSPPPPPPPQDMSMPAFPPVPPKVMGAPPFPPPPPAHPAPPVAPIAATSAAPSKPLMTGMVISYNGRQRRGMILADQGQKMLQIAPDGAPTVGSAPPRPEGLMHGTRVTFSPLVLPGSGLVCCDVCPVEGQVGLECGVDSQAGSREVNEDRILAADLPDGVGHLEGIIDGHRGINCADFLAQGLPYAVMNSVRERFEEIARSGRSMNSLTTAEEVDIIGQGLINAFEACDRDFLQAAQVQCWSDGACALLTLVAHGFGEASTGTVLEAPGGVAKCFIAWCGTSRMLLLRGRQHVTCTRDHLCSDQEERERLQARGALLVQDPQGEWWMGRPDQREAARKRQQGYDDGGPKKFLAASRGFGDSHLKETPQCFFGEQRLPVLTVTPEVSVVDLTPDDWGIVLVGRGICSVLPDQDIADVCLQEMGTMKKGPVETAQVLTARATQRGAKDNLTCVVQRLGWAAAPSQMSLGELLTACKAAANGSSAAEASAAAVVPALVAVSKKIEPAVKQPVLVPPPAVKQQTLPPGVKQPSLVPPPAVKQQTLPPGVKQSSLAAAAWPPSTAAPWKSGMPGPSPGQDNATSSTWTGTIKPVKPKNSVVVPAKVSAKVGMSSKAPGMPMSPPGLDVTGLHTTGLDATGWDATVSGAVGFDASMEYGADPEQENHYLGKRIDEALDMVVDEAEWDAEVWDVDSETQPLQKGKGKGKGKGKSKSKSADSLNGTAGQEGGDENFTIKPLQKGKCKGKDKGKGKVDGDEDHEIQPLQKGKGKDKSKGKGKGKNADDLKGKGKKNNEDIPDWQQSCPDGHPLKKFKTPSDECACNVCGNDFPEGTVFHGCRKCDYDLCTSCLQSSKAYVSNVAAGSNVSHAAASSNPLDDFFNERPANTEEFGQEATGMAESPPGLNASSDSPTAETGASAEVAATSIDPSKRYRGVLNWWDHKKKYGSVTLNASYALEEIPGGALHLEELQINSGDQKLPAIRSALKKGLEVEFCIVTDEDGAHECVDVTLPGGLPVTQANVERRKLACEETFTGTVDDYNNWGFGYIKPDTPDSLPAMVRAAMVNEMEEFRKKKPNSPAILSLYFRKEDVKGSTLVKKGGTCSFQVYMDEKGAGACNITMTYAQAVD